MADKKLQYIIEMIADDQKIRKQMKSWDWEDIMGTKGKDFGEFVADSVKNSRDDVKNAFKGLNIDWTQILGTKEIAQLEQSLTRALAKKRDMITGFIASGDTANIERTVDIVAELGNEFKSLGSNFDVKSLVRGMGALADVLAPFVKETKKIKDVFSNLFNTFDGKKGELVPTFNFEGVGKQVDAEVKKIQDSLNQLSDESKKIKINVNASSTLSQFNNEIEKISNAIDKTEDRIDELIEASQNAVKGSDVERKANIDLANTYLERATQYKKLIQMKKISKSVTDQVLYDLGMDEDIKVMFEESRDNAKKILGTLLHSDKRMENTVGIGVTAPSADDIIRAVNTAIDEVNTKAKALHTIKLKVDDQLEPISGDKIIDSFQVTKNKKTLEKEIANIINEITELDKKRLSIQNEIDNAPKKDETRVGMVNEITNKIASLEQLKKANEDLLADADNLAVQYALSTIMNGYNAIEKVVDNRQNKILDKTDEWRKRMIGAMQIDKADVNIQLGFDKGLEASTDALYNYLQQYFEENQIELHINKDAFVKEIKDAVANGGVSVGSIGGGTVDLNPQTLKNAIAEGLIAALTGDFIPNGVSSTTTQPAETSSAKKQKLVYLDPSSSYMKHMTEVVRTFAEYTQKDNAQTAKIKAFFDRKIIDVDENGKPVGVQIDKYADATSMDVADMLAKLIERHGVTLLDDFDNLLKDVGKNRIAQNFRSDLAELLHTQNIGQRTLTDEERRVHSIEVFKDLVDKSKMLEPFNVKNPKWKVSEIADFDKIFTMATNGLDQTSAEYKNIVQSFERLKTVITNEDGLDGDAQKERLQTAVLEFKESIHETYDTLTKYVNAFEMDVFVKGAKKPYRVSSRYSTLRANDAVGDDDTKLSDVRIYKDINTAALGTTARNQELKMLYTPGAKFDLTVPYPDRTDILYKDTSIDEFKEAENTVKPWKDESTAVERAEKRAKKATDSLKNAEERAAKLAETETSIQKQITEKNTQKAELEKDIAINQENIAKLNTNSRKIAGARTRLNNRQTALSAAEQAKKEAELNKKIIEGTDFSERDTELSDIFQKRAKYEAWMKNPEEYDDDIVDTLYDGIMKSYRSYKEAAEKELNRLNNVITNTPQKLSELRAKASVATQNGDLKALQKIEEEIRQAQQNQNAASKSLPSTQAEYNKYTQLLSEIYAKIARDTEADKAAFDSDFQAYISKQLKELDVREANIGADPREEAEVRLSKAEKDYQKAQKEYDKVASSEEGKAVVEIDRLKAENQTLQKQIDDLSTELTEAEAKQNKIADEKKSGTTSERLLQSTQRSEIDTLFKDADNLQQKIQKSKQEAEAVNKMVQDIMDGETYQHPKYNIKHTKKNQEKVDKHSAILRRSLYLKSVANGTAQTDDKIPTNLTPKMSNAIDELANSREIIKRLFKTESQSKLKEQVEAIQTARKNQDGLNKQDSAKRLQAAIAEFQNSIKDFGLDKFKTDDALRAEIKDRFARSESSENQLHPIVQEFYNKILKNGKQVATEWLQTTLESVVDDKSKYSNELKGLAQKDTEWMENFKPELQNAQQHLKESFQKQVKIWAESIRKKIALIDKGNLKTEEKALAIKEIEELFTLIDKASAAYTSEFRGEEFLSKKSDLDYQLKEKKISKSDYVDRFRQLIKENNEMLLKELLGDNIDLNGKKQKFVYSSYLSQDETKHTNELNANYEKILENLKQKEPLLVTRQGELLKNIELATKANDTEQVKSLETQLDQINQELAVYQSASVGSEEYFSLKERQQTLLQDIQKASMSNDITDRQKLEQLNKTLASVTNGLAKYQDYKERIERSTLTSLFFDDAEFMAQYRDTLSEIIKMEQQVDLSKAKGVSKKALSQQYQNIDTKRADLDNFVYNSLQNKQNELLADNIPSLYKHKAELETQATSLSNAITEAKNADKPFDDLSEQLQDVNKKIRENNASIAKTESLLTNVNKLLTPLELNQRRATDMDISGIAYKADEAVMNVYNKTTQEAIELEQKLALARAKGADVEEALSAQRSQKRKRTNALERAQQEREQRESENSPRVQALRYLTKTEDAYTTALEKRATLNRRIKVKEAQIDDIENDHKYSTSWQYKRHQRTVKDRLVNEYVGSEQYHNDRAAGMANVEESMKTYLEESLTPEAVEQVLYQLKQTLGKRGDKIDVTSLQDMYHDILRDSVEYQQYFEDRKLEYQKILVANAGTIDTDVSDLNLAIDAMHKSRDALEAGKERIEQEKQANIAFIKSASANDYAPLQQEMQKVATRVNLKSMVSRFKDVVAQNRSREATINNLKHQVLQAGGNQTEANHLAKELNGIGKTALKDVHAWAKEFLPKIFLTTEEEFRNQARQNLIANEERYAQREIGELQRAYTRDEKEVRSIFNRETNKGADSFINKYLGTLVDDLKESDFQDVASSQFKEIVSTFKNLLQKNVYDIVSNYSKSLVVEHGKLGGIDIRAEIRHALLQELDILQKQQPGVDEDIAHIEAQRKAAMKFGSIGYGEIADTDVLREQAILTSKLTAEKEKQKELETQIATLEKTEDSEEELGRLNKALDESNKSIATLQMLVDNRDTLLELQHQAKEDEKAEQQWTPEKQKLWLTNKLEVAKANLENADETVRKEAEQQIVRYTELLNNLEAKVATEEAERRKDSSLIGVMTKALKDAFGGKGGFALDATGIASEATLSQILQVLNGFIAAFGGKIVRDPEMEKKLARMRELEAKRGVVSEAKVNKTTSDNTKKTNEKNPIAEEMIKRIKAEVKEEKDLPKLIKALVDGIKPENKGTKEDTEDRFRLHRAFAEYKEQNKNIPGVPTYKDNKGELQHSYKELAKHLGVEGADQLRIYENKIHELANTGFVEGQKQVENEKKKTAETAKQVENENKSQSRYDRTFDKSQIRKLTSMDDVKWFTSEYLQAQQRVKDAWRMRNAKVGKEKRIEAEEYMSALMKQLESQMTEAARKKYGSAYEVPAFESLNIDSNKRIADAIGLSAITQESEKQLKNAQATTAETAKQVENEKRETSTEAILKPVLDSNKKEIIAGTSINDLKSGQKDAYANYIGKQVGSYKTSDAIFSDEKALKAKVQELKGVMSTAAKDSEEYLKAMVEMSRLISTWRNVVKKTKPEMSDNAKWQEYLTTGEGKLFDKEEEVPLGGITSSSKVTLKQTAMSLGTKISDNAKNELFVAKEAVKPIQQKAEAKEREANAEKKITEEKQKQKEVFETKGWTNKDKAEYEKLAKETKDYAPKVVFGEGGTFGGLALDSTLQDILTVIKKIKTEGIKKGGSGSNNTAKNKNKTEADLIRDRALSQDDTVKGLAAGRGDLYDKYMAEVAALNKAVDDANTAKKNKKTPDMRAVKAAAEKVSALTKNILRDTAQWDYTVKQSDIVKDFKLPKGQQMTKEIMQNAIKGTFDPKTEKYDFLNFDNGKLIYQLTDLGGHIRTVTAEWNDFNQQLAITSDKSVGKLDPLVAKVDELKTKFENAKSVGYLKGDDNNLADFTNKLAAISQATTIDDVERLRQEAINIGEIVNKTISHNKRLFAGTGAKKSVDNQYNKIIGARRASGQDFEDQFVDDSPLFNEYYNAYNQLNKDYQTYVNNHQLNDPKIQQQIQQEASKVQTLGKKYLSSVTQAAKLKELAEQSGTYTDVRTGKEHQLGGWQSITDDEIKKLDTTMRDYATSLYGANLENIKINKTTQTLTGTVRTSKDTVADIVVQYNQATQALYGYNKQERESLTGLAGFIKSMKGKMKSILQYTTSITSIYRVFGELRRGIQYIREIDSALTELKKVTSETEKTYDKFLQTASKTADIVGSTIKELVSSTADWARIGYSLEDAATLAETTAVLLNVSEFQSIEDATSALTSTLQAFSMTAETSMRAVDVLNEVGNNFAISSDGIATALQDSASSLVAANNSYEEAVALIAAANRVVQDPNSVGAALRTISLRLRGTSAKELEEAGEDTDGAIESKSKLRSKVKGLSGVDILTDTGAYKSTYEILLDISKVWKDMSDINQAALLEILAGKTRSNTAAAILSNTKDLKKAYEQALEAEGSALAENEKYLDSIQGRIDLFTNSVQTMWNNALDSDVIKWFVDLGTKLIKAVDTLGLIPSILATIGATKGITKLFKSFDVSGATLQSALTYINSLTVGFQKNAIAQTASNAVILKQAATNKLLNSSIIQRLATEQLDGQLKEANMAREVKLVALKQALELAEEQYAQGLIDDIALQTAKNAVDAASVPINLSQFSATTILGAAFNGLALSIANATKAMIAFLFTNPVGWMILLVGAIVGGVAAWNKWGDTTENIQKKLEELKTEISGISSELDSLNSELKTTQSRMAELLALDKLSFTEEEELKNLQKTNDALERKIYLLEQEQKRKQKDAEDEFDKLMSDEFTRGTNQAGMSTNLTEIQALEAIKQQHKINIGAEKEAEEALVEAEQGGNQKEIRKAKRKLKKAKKSAQRTQKYIDNKLEEYTTNADGIDYDTADTETKKYLDYVYNFEDWVNIINGDDSAQTHAIKRIFNKDEFSTVSDEIDELVEKLKKNPTDQTVFEDIRKQCQLAEKDLLAVGLSVDEATRYFTQLGSTSGFGALDKKVKELDEASKTFEELLTNRKVDIDGESIGLTDLFDKEGKIIQTKLSQIFKNTDAQTRKDITSILEGSYDDIKNGTMDIGSLLTKFSFKASKQIINIEKELFTSHNKELFPNLKDEISGIIDTFDELATAVGSVVDAMDLLDQARAEEAYSGSVSLETLQNLMAYTDDYSKLVSVDETGAIHLATNAQEILIQEKLNAIKANALLAYEEANKAYQEALAAKTSVSAADTIKNMLIPVIDSVSGGLSFLGSLWTSVGEAWSDGFGGKTFNLSEAINNAQSAYNSTVSSRQNDRETESETTLTQAEEALEKAEANLRIAENLTADNIKTRSDSGTASGGNDTKDDVENDAFQREMDYWENRIAASQARYEQVQNEIDLLEAKGQRASADHYKKQIELEDERRKLLESQRAAAKKYLDDLVNAGKEGSEEWWNAAEILNDIENELDGIIKNVWDLYDAIAELNKELSEETHERISNLVTDLGNIRDILSYEDMFDEEGHFTEAGVANIATYVDEIARYKDGIQQVDKELSSLGTWESFSQKNKHHLDLVQSDIDISKAYNGNEEYYKGYGIKSAEEYKAFTEFLAKGITSEQEFYDEMIRLTDQRDDYTKGIKESEKAVVEMYENQIDAVEDYTSKLVDSYNDYIDSVKEALDAERELYDFKKNIESQTKNISSLERRISALSGSTAAEDIAERRKLEAELAEAKEGINDTYRDNALDAQQNALDKEAQAYEETMNRYVEGLRNTLKEATIDMTAFVNTIAGNVVANADTVYDQYTKTGVSLDQTLVQPWLDAKAEIEAFEGAGGALDRMNSWTEENGPFDIFANNATEDLKSPFVNGTDAVYSFGQSVSDAMDTMYTNIHSNVAKSLAEIQKLTTESEKVYDTNIQPNVVTNNKGNQTHNVNNVSKKYGNMTSDDVMDLQDVLRTVFGAKIDNDGKYGPATKSAVTAVQQKLGVEDDGLYGKNTRDAMEKYIKNTWLKEYGGSSMYGEAIREMLRILPSSYYAKGTMGTDKNEWAITDEPWLGDELVLVPTAQGNLSYMRKGTSVVPAAITKNLVEWGKMNPHTMNAGISGANVNMISNAVVQPNYEFTFDSLVHVDNCAQDTLKDLEKLVDNKINQFSRQLNYSLKKFAR